MAISSALGVAGAVPVGVVDAFAGATAPAGWLLCYGQAVSRTAYPVLFTTLSTTYGSGDGSTTFNIPDMRGRAVAGKDDMGGSAASRLTATVLSAANTLGATGGTQTHTMTSAEMPVHGHPVDHDPIDSRSQYNGTSNNGQTLLGTNVTTVITYWPYDGTATSGSTQTAGGGGAHLNTQPTIVLNYIIKAL